jgi:hypothetical protein
MTTSRRDFFVRSASAIAAGTLLRSKLIEEGSGQTPPAETLYVNAGDGADSHPARKTSR